MQVRLAQSDDDLARIAPVLGQLRPQYTPEQLRDAVVHQQSLDYRLAFVEDDDGQVLSVAGFVIVHKLAWGRSLYVDDLVTSASARSTGAGRCLMDWLKAYARDADCRQLHLDSGVQRFDAHRFYLREGFRIASHHFSLDLD